jgi:NADH-quinone oxidoreductase subunit L
MTSEFAVRLILLLPLLVAAFNGMMGLFAPAYRKQETLIGALATLAVAVPFGLTLLLFIGYTHGSPEVVTYFTWMVAGDLSVDFAYRIDELSLIMTLIVTGVGALIHMYSMGYMHGDPGYWRFFAYLNLFIFAMLNLVLAENLLVLFLGWEGVGLCSYLLIGFWYTDRKNSLAANKAFIVNRIGDFAFLLGVFILYRAVVNDGGMDLPFGLDFTTLLSEPGLAAVAGVGGIATLLLFIGATGKSAQIPLFVWLPDAMAGPTPVSALIHAATMVTSGLYLLARLSPMIIETAAWMMPAIAIVGALTAIMAATIAITQNDIKRVLAYSTVSQLGFMFMAAGVGAFFVAIFHVMTHAFFKACLFLGSGSVIHSMHHVQHELEHKGVLPSHHGDPHTPLSSEARVDTLRDNPLPYEGPFDPQDMRTMGGLRKYMPQTAITFGIATAAIAGIPLLAGFFSKDEILFFAFQSGYLGGMTSGYFVWAIGLITAALTAIYMTRCYVLTFEGRERWPGALDVKPHESPALMTIPLWVLAGLSIVGGYIGLPDVVGYNWIHHYLGVDYGGPVAETAYVEEIGAGLVWGMMGLGGLIALGGVLFAWFSWSKSGLGYDRQVRRRLGPFYSLFSRKYFWDEAYDAAFVRPIERGSERVLAPFDERIVDGSVNGIARLVRWVSGSIRGIQTGQTQTYALAFVLGVVAVIAIMVFA